MKDLGDNDIRRNQSSVEQHREHHKTGNVLSKLEILS